MQMCFLNMFIAWGVRAQIECSEREGCGGRGSAVKQALPQTTYRPPTSVGQVDGGRHHGFTVCRGNLCHQTKVQQGELAGVGALGHLEQVPGVGVAAQRRRQWEE